MAYHHTHFRCIQYTTFPPMCVPSLTFVSCHIEQLLLSFQVSTGGNQNSRIPPSPIWGYGWNKTPSCFEGSRCSHKTDVGGLITERCHNSSIKCVQLLDHFWKQLDFFFFFLQYIHLNINYCFIFLFSMSFCFLIDRRGSKKKRWESSSNKGARSVITKVDTLCDIFHKKCFIDLF